MTPRSIARYRGAIATLAVLVPLAAWVVWSSLRTGAVACEVCIRFEGREACRTVEASSEEEGLRAAIDNACGILASGVTRTLRCTRTAPTRSACRPL